MKVETDAVLVVFWSCKELTASVLVCVFYVESQRMRLV